MKLYRKKLSGLDDLEREKIRLRYQELHLDEVNSGDRKHSAKGQENAGILNSLLDLAGSGNTTNNAIWVGSQLYNLLGKKRRNGKAAVHTAAEIPKQKSTAWKVFNDIFWSYVVGKAVRVSVGVLKDSLQKKKGHLRK